MSKWLRPLKVREYYLDLHFDSIKAADKWLYLAVVRGAVRARSNGLVLGPEWIRQLSRMTYAKMITRLLYRRTLNCLSMTSRGRLRVDRPLEPAAPPRNRCNKEPIARISASSRACRCECHPTTPSRRGSGVVGGVEWTGPPDLREVKNR